MTLIDWTNARSFQKEQLEALLDKTSLHEVLDMLSEICSEKQEHVQTNWQDKNLAKAWGRCAYSTAACANEQSVLTVS
jgi:hypothetical protein